MTRKISYERLRDIPVIVKAACWSFEGWIVGGSAEYLLGEADTVRDWDVIVPCYRWMDFLRLIPHKTPANTFGGFKVTAENGMEVDVWPSDIGRFFIEASYKKIAVQPKSEIIAKGE